MNKQFLIEIAIENKPKPLTNSVSSAEHTSHMKLRLDAVSSPVSSLIFASSRNEGGTLRDEPKHGRDGAIIFYSIRKGMICKQLAYGR